MKQRFEGLALRIDQFGQTFSFNVSRGQKSHTSVLGSFFTLFIVPVTVVYGVLQYIVMYHFQDTNILIQKHLNYFTDDFTLSTASDSLQVAFAFVNYQDPNEAFEDEAEYGET